MNILKGSLSVGEGLPGRTPLLRNNITHIQWKYTNEDENAWRDLVEIERLKASEIELRVHENFIQWKYNHSEQWYNLISLEDLKPTELIEILEEKIEIITNIINDAKTTVDELVKRVDNAILGQGVVDEYYLQNNYYNKTEVDEKIQNIPSIIVTSDTSTENRKEGCLYIVTS